MTFSFHFLSHNEDSLAQGRKIIEADKKEKEAKVLSDELDTINQKLSRLYTDNTIKKLTPTWSEEQIVEQEKLMNRKQEIESELEIEQN